MDRNVYLHMDFLHRLMQDNDAKNLVQKQYVTNFNTLQELGLLASKDGMSKAMSYYSSAAKARKDTIDIDIVDLGRR